jgi:hypothetical protein
MTKFLLIAVIFFSIFSIDQAWAQDSESFAEDLFDDPVSFFHPDGGKGFTFFLFIIGIAIYSLFVWHFYRFISKRNLLPKSFRPITEGRKIPKIKIAGYIAAYGVLFPTLIFIWFTVLAFFVFLIAEDMPFNIAIFVSMAIIGVVRILSYYREEAAKEVAKMIPYAILSFLLISAAVYANPNFFTEKNFISIPQKFVEHFEGIIAALIIITVFEFTFRIAFIIKRKIWPVSDKKLEDEIEIEIDDRIHVHFKKIEEKEKNLDKKFEEMMKKLNDSEKS